MAHTMVCLQFTERGSPGEPAGHEGSRKSPGCNLSTSFQTNITPQCSRLKNAGQQVIYIFKQGLFGLISYNQRCMQHALFCKVLSFGCSSTFSSFTLIIFFSDNLSFNTYTTHIRYKCHDCRKCLLRSYMLANMLRGLCVFHPRKAPSKQVLL